MLYDARYSRIKTGWTDFQTAWERERAEQEAERVRMRSVQEEIAEGEKARMKRAEEERVEKERIGRIREELATVKRQMGEIEKTRKERMEKEVNRQGWWSYLTTGLGKGAEEMEKEKVRKEQENLQKLASERIRIECLRSEMKQLQRDEEVQVNAMWESEMRDYTRREKETRAREARESAARESAAKERQARENAARRGLRKRERWGRRRHGQGENAKRRRDKRTPKEVCGERRNGKQERMHLWRQEHRTSGKKRERQAGTRQDKTSTHRVQNGVSRRRMPIPNTAHAGMISFGARLKADIVASFAQWFSIPSSCNVLNVCLWLARLAKHNCRYSWLGNERLTSAMPRNVIGE